MPFVVQFGEEVMTQRKRSRRGIGYEEWFEERREEKEEEDE